MVVPHPICVAAAHGNLEQLRAYFSAGDRDPNDIDEHHGQTLLDYACRGGRSDVECRISCPMLSFLLSQGASLNYQDPGGTWHRPLVIAAVMRLFAWAPAGRTDSRRRTRSAQVAVTAAPLPRDVFKLVISFWRPTREWWWSSHTYSRVNRYDAPWMG